MKKISIIVPIYNAEKYLNECIESIVNQTYKNIEIILINDGSFDNSSKICDKWQKKDERIIVLNKENEGVAKTIAKGIQICTGDYITFSDSDDYVSNNFIEKMFDAVNISEADIAVCNYIKKTETKEEKSNEIKGNMLFISGDNISNCAQLYMGWQGIYLVNSRSNKLIKRELLLNSLKDINYNVYMGEDLNLTFAAMARANRVALIPDCLFYYRHVESSVSNTKRNHWPNYKELIKALVKINNENNLGLEKEIYNLFASSYINDCIEFVINNKTPKEIRQFLKDDFLLDVIGQIDKNSFKKKIYYWAIKNRFLLIIKLAIKVMKK